MQPVAINTHVGYFTILFSGAVTRNAEVHEYIPYHSLLVLEVSLFQKGCLPQQADRFGNH